jgi:short-subunit dehydrogenase
MMALTIITGASSGIGRSLARRFAAGGDAVAVIARRRDLLDSLVDEIERNGGHAIAIRCDVTDGVAVRAAVQQAELRFGPTTRLIANAGGGSTTPVDGFSAAHVAEVVNLNLIGVANCVEAVLPGMLARRAGHLVVTSSLAGYRGLPSAAAYSAAKAALTNMMESLRIDLRPRGVDVSVIAPGFVRVKPGKKKRPKPFQLDLEEATRLMHHAITRRKPYYAFPKTLVALIWLGRLMPSALYDRALAGRGRAAAGAQ